MNLGLSLLVLFFNVGAHAATFNATALSDCLASTSRHATTQKLEIRGTINQCLIKLKYSDIEIESVKQNTQTFEIFISVGKNEHEIIFNDNSLMYTDSESPKGDILNLQMMLDNPDNTYDANFCSQPPTYNEFGFGFAKEKNTCKRQCKKGEVRVGKRVPLFTQNYTHLMTNDDTDEQMEQVSCQSCAVTTGGDDYYRTSENTNLCYDKSGCPQGFEVSDGTVGSSKSVVGLNGVTCLAKCASYQSRDLNGHCEQDPEKTCELSKTAKENLKNWKDNFQNAIAGGFAKCSDEQLKNLDDYAQIFVDSRVRRLEISESTGCEEPVDDILGNPMSLRYFSGTENIRPTMLNLFKTCFETSADLANRTHYDATVESLLFEDLNPGVLSGDTMIEDTDTTMVTGARAASGY